jgi:hypothetical protein
VLAMVAAFLGYPSDATRLHDPFPHVGRVDCMPVSSRQESKVKTRP